jgi:hypothetical protein
MILPSFVQNWPLPINSEARNQFLFYVALQSPERSISDIVLNYDPYMASATLASH